MRQRRDDRRLPQTPRPGRRRGARPARLPARRDDRLQPRHAALPDRRENFGSIAFQLPELGLLTLAMLVPILSGGLNLAITYTANFCGLTLAWVLQAHGGVDAGFGAFILGCVAALAVGALAGLIMGAGDRLCRRPPDPRLAGDDDLHPRPRRIPDPRRRHLGLPELHPADRPWQRPRHSHPAPRLPCRGGGLVCDARPHAARLLDLHARLQHRGDALFRHPDQAHPHPHLHAVGR